MSPRARRARAESLTDWSVQRVKFGLYCWFSTQNAAYISGKRRFGGDAPSTFMSVCGFES
ncbi:hypothetical protein BN903_22 [Halorubrum sp. AJ67]|nr:hypothetical protein BN903_22 [Halorubrum sp. AJ67]